MRNSTLLFIALCLIPSLGIEALPAKVFIIRHADKPEKIETGNSLSIKGHERAAAFVPYFMETPSLITAGTPVAIYAMAPESSDTYSHSIETVTPLAEKLKLTLITKFDKANYKKMVDEIKTTVAYNGKTVLICWDHSVIPEMARAFGALQTPARWPNTAFDRVWEISYSSTSKALFHNTAQRLLYGDSAA
ncbi:MAG: hypothetical protein WCF65_03055 [Parachlamydiaceae bacterium]